MFADIKEKMAKQQALFDLEHECEQAAHDRESMVRERELKL